MKRVLFAVFFVWLTVGVAMAKPVDASKARRVAEVYLQARGMHNTAALVDVTSQTPFTEFYVFAAPQGGFVLVSGDDCVKPILGYSLTSRFEAKEIPEQVKGWLEGYEKEIRWWKQEDAGVVNGQWARLEAGEATEPLLETAVSPMMTTTWNQSPYYNALCPYHDSTEARSVTGCVATATAQVMKYWNHPATGYGSNTYTSSRTKEGIHYVFPDLTADFGSTTYQWDSMPNALTAVSREGEVNAVATLMYHVGVGVEMAYTPVASGAKNYNVYGTISSSSQTALMKYFKYRADMAALSRIDYTDSVFSALLRAELDQNRPILFSGSDPDGGHSFVFDGYDTENQFHVNWGWGGYYDGYYVIGDLHPSSGGTGSNSSYTFNLDNVALIGIQPHTGWDTVGNTTVNMVSNGHGSVSGSGSYAFGDTVVMKAEADAGYRFSGWSDGSKFNQREIIANGGSYTFTANFEALAGDTLHYCPGNRCLGSYRGGDVTTWGIMLPASIMSPTKALSAVQLYINYAGDYHLQIYSGSSQLVLLVDTTVTFVDNIYQWQTITLDNPVDASHDLRIIFSSNISYPATFTYGSGVPESFIWGDGFYAAGTAWDVTAMIKGIFSTAAVTAPYVIIDAPETGIVNADLEFSALAPSNATVTWNFEGGTPATVTGDSVVCRWTASGTYQVVATATNAAGSVSDTVEVRVYNYAEGDTVAYCNDSPFWQSIGYVGVVNKWGIMIPPSYLVDRDTLKEVLLYLKSAGDYTLEIYSGGDDAPGTLVYSQNYFFGPSQLNGYVHCLLDSVVLIDKQQNLWVVFSTDAPYPAAACFYTGEPNSDWIFSDDTTWVHMSYWGSEYEKTWMIKAITAKAVVHEGIEDIEMKDGGLRIYPNPASDKVTIVLNEELRMKNEELVEVLDLQGRCVYTQALKHSGNQTITLDVSAIPNGAYFVKLGTHHSSFIIHH